MFRLLASIEAQLKVTNDLKSLVSDKDKAGWDETTVVVLSGITNLLADYLDVVSSHHTFKSSWKSLLGHFRVLLGFETLEINTAVFKALQQILSKGNGNEKNENFDSQALDLAWDLWSESVPLVKYDKNDKRFDNQEYLFGYVSAFQELYRLIESQLSIDRLRMILKLLKEATQQATAATYSADIEYLTRLQIQVLESLKMIRSDIDGVPAALINQAAEFVALAFETRSLPSDKQRPTYVALSKASMTLSESLILTHSSDRDIYTSGALSSSLEALSKPIVLKYAYPITTKSNITLATGNYFLSHHLESDIANDRAHPI